MELFNTEMLRIDPSQSGERGSYRGRRRRYGCRCARAPMQAQPLAVAIRLALSPLPALSVQPAVYEAGNEAAAA